MLKPMPQEQLDAAQAQLKEQLRPAMTATAFNVGLASALDAVSYFRYNGRRYEIQPLPYKRGIALQELYMEFQKLGEQTGSAEGFKSLSDLCLLTAELMFKCCQPASRVVRLLWKLGWLRNPFLDASAHDIAQLIGFFLSCRMKSSVQLLGSLAHRPALSSSMQSTN